MALNEITVKEDLSNIDILNNVEEMLKCIESKEMRALKKEGDVGKYKAELIKRFTHLNGRYPQIFNMIMMYERTFDIEKLKWMLNMLDKTKDGTYSRDQADKIVAFKEFDTYIKPKIDYEKERETMELKRSQI